MSKPIEVELTHISLLSGLLESSESNLLISSGYCNGLYNFYLLCTKTPDLILLYFHIFFCPISQSVLSLKSYCILNHIVFYCIVINYKKNR